MMWKESRVVLVHKGGTKKEVRNYIPIVIINQETQSLHNI